MRRVCLQEPDASQRTDLASGSLFFRSRDQPIRFASLNVSSNLRVPEIRPEFVKPSRKLLQIFFGQGGDILLNFLKLCHVRHIAWKSPERYNRQTMPKLSKSNTLSKRAPRDVLHSPHPGEILLEEFLKPANLSQNALTRAIGVPPRRINEIVLGKRAATADTDLRLCRYYGMSEGFFLGLQIDYDILEQKRTLGDKLNAIMPRAA
jgi:antitoxin HigA-1